MNCGQIICEHIISTKRCSRSERRGKRLEMRKTLVWILVLSCAVSLLSGCGGKKELEPRAFTDELLSGAGFADSLNRLDDPVVPILYDIDSSDYTEAIVYCGTAATAEEIAVFTAKDDAAAERLLSAARARVDHLIESYRSYGPAAAMTLENSVVSRSGDHVVVVICSDSEGAKKICSRYF